MKQAEEEGKKRICSERPEGCGSDESARELAFKSAVERGLDDARHGRVITNEEMGRRIRSWRK